MTRRNRRRGRDAVVTGIGLCLPGTQSPVLTADELWEVASTGTSCLVKKGVYYGSVNLSKETFEERVVGVPDFFSRHYTNAHRFGLVSLAQACADAGLDVHRDLETAAVLVGRGGVDANIDSYLAVLRADPATLPVAEAMEMFVAAEQSVTPSDVALVQGALTRSKGANFTVSCGCASSALQIGNAQRMIASGETEIAVVTGVDVFSVPLIHNIQRLLSGAQQTYDAMRSQDMPALLPSFESLMRPYDRRADCINHGEGSATIVLESRDHAFARDARLYGQVLAQATTRDGLANPLACDDTGKALVSAVRRCLGDTWEIDQVPYVHGGSDGNAVVTTFEANAIRELYGPASRDLLMSSQEGCFGHNGAPAGCLGVALTLLMMNHGQVCPTANCEEPADNLTFDPVPGTATRSLDFDYALSFNYQVGGVKSAILLGSPEV
ncbi:beta-ketoacyl synthase N-terminal-like domain-containing protein [Streptomyces sp. NBC_01233]|uniref:beta-ketoacyl synthase N-terminal-like domain-containing protein n=1 Tax=Streptomyces sp. NBC_01233 TaxID=2903787 RepID=UPI002E121D82|nr:ketoacyl synthase [Streptomyces sp. NBC_01233]